MCVCGGGGFYYLLLLFVFRFILYAVLCDIVAFCLLLNVGKIVTVLPQFSLLLLFVTIVTVVVVVVVIVIVAVVGLLKLAKHEKQSQWK